ncbi:MAG TPA: hypothetical protein VKT75_18695 [Acidobacteriaceae bacterium]|jgi:hypothetical protein|nr:hypothetical protein [Acidobacteriaceae bacterium]
MPANDPLALTIGPGPQYTVSQSNASTTQSKGVQFTPPAGGCTLCITTGKIDGKTTINLTETKTYHGNQLEVGTIVYDTYGPNTDCSNPPKRPVATVGNSINVGSGSGRPK